MTPATAQRRRDASKNDENWRICGACTAKSVRTAPWAL